MSIRASLLIYCLNLTEFLSFGCLFYQLLKELYKIFHYNSFVNFCFMYFEDVLLKAYKLTVFIYFGNLKLLSVCDDLFSPLVMLFTLRLLSLYQHSHTNF